MSTTTARKRPAADKPPEIKPPTPRPRDDTEDDNEPMLEIEAFAPERPTIKVHTSPADKEGTLCEIRMMGEFGIAEQQRLTRDSAEYEKLWNQDSLTKREGERLKVLLDRMFETVLEAPAKVKALVNDQQRANVVTAFTYAPYVIAAAREEREKREAGITDETDETPDESLDLEDESTTET